MGRRDSLGGAIGCFVFTACGATSTGSTCGPGTALVNGQCVVAGGADGGDGGPLESCPGFTLHGAPRALVRTACRAARDEIRHTRITRALARRHGGALREPRVAPTAERSLQAMATENAVEGCVRETFGALLATYQAEHARDPVIRAAMLRIARDETRHAALAWQVAGWLNTKLDRAARARVTAAARAAALELVREGVESTPDLVIAGLPNAERSRAIARDLFDALEADGGTHPL